jgi:hypothetical protein
MSQPTNPRDSRVQRMIRQCATWLRALLLENWGAKLLSILIALALWAGLISQDPTLTREKSFRNVAISVNGQETLRRNGFIVLDDLEEALDDAADQASKFILNLMQQGQDVPPASEYADIEVEDPDDFVNYVVLDMGAYSDAHAQKSVRKNITIPSWLNAYGEAHHVNFSRILQEALLNMTQQKRDDPF